MPIGVSESQFMSGVQCLKRLYWQVHEPELTGVPDAAAIAIMEQAIEASKSASLLVSSSQAEWIETSISESGRRCPGQADRDVSVILCLIRGADRPMQRKN
jgi:hypothetical protein